MHDGRRLSRQDGSLTADILSLHFSLTGAYANGSCKTLGRKEIISLSRALQLLDTCKNRSLLVSMVDALAVGSLTN